MVSELAVIEGIEIAAGNIGPADVLMQPAMMTAMLEFAEVMARSKVTLPKHLQGSPADCMAIIMQSAQWKMNPFAVAQKTHIVNGTLGYEAQLVNAVVSSSSLLETRIQYGWEGDWKAVNGKTDKDESRAVTVSAILRGEAEPRVLRVSMAQVGTVRNSPLWESDPRQQLAYLATKRWARLYTPDVLLGVYTPDELHERVIDVAPVPQCDQPAKQSAAEKLKSRVKGREPAPQLAQPEPHGETQTGGDGVELEEAAKQLAERIGKAQANDMKALVAEMERFKDTPHIEPLGDIYRTRAKFLRAASAEAENNG